MAKFILNGETFGLGGQSQEIYSTEETWIGTWIDGKPLYRRVWQGLTPSVKLENVILFNVENVGYVAHLYGVFISSTGSYIPIVYAVSEATIHYTIALFMDKNGQVKMNINEGSSFMNRPVTVVVEYTKTTDSAQSAASLEKEYDRLSKNDILSVGSEASNVEKTTG